MTVEWWGGFFLGVMIVGTPALAYAYWHDRTLRRHPFTTALTAVSWIAFIVLFFVWREP